MSVKIITDTISDISPEIAREYDIEVLPVNVILGREKHKDDESFPQEHLIEWIEANHEFPNIRGLEVEEFKRVFEKYIHQDNDIIFIAPADNILSDYNCAILAALDFNHANIKIINSKTYSATLAMLVIKAAIMSREGYSCQRIADEINRLLTHPTMSIVLNSIEFLVYTTHCPPVLNVGEKLFHMKYHLYASVGKTFSMEILPANSRKAVEKFCSTTFKTADKYNSERIIIVYTEHSEDALNYINDYIRGLNYFKDIILMPCKSYTTAIGGRNALGLAYIERETAVSQGI